MKSSLFYQISQADLHPSFLNIKFNGISSYKSITGGILSIICLAVILGITFFKLLDVFSMNHLSIDTLVDRNDFSLIDIYDLNPGIRLKVGSSTSHTFVKFQDQFQYGINVTVQLNYLTKINGTNYQQTLYLPAIQNQEDYTFSFPEIDDFRNHSLFGRLDFTASYNEPDGDRYRRLSFRILKCDHNINSSCGSYENNIYLNFWFQNHRINLTEINQSKIVQPQTKFRVFQAPTPFQGNSALELDYFFAKANIITDYSIWPEIIHKYLNDKTTSNISTWFYNQQTTTIQYYRGEQNDDLLKLCFKRSIYTYNHHRNFKKFDSSLAQIFGLIGLISLITNIVYQGYNKWSFKQYRLKKMGYDIKSPTLPQYYCVSIINFCIKVKNFICCNSNQQEYQQKEDYLDYYHLLSRIKFLEEALQKQDPQNENILKIDQYYSQLNQSLLQKQQDQNMERSQSVNLKNKTMKNKQKRYTKIF